ncbi:MAG: phosphatidic acid phosphatase type 2/haloperoxidase [Piptocephalis tieghemiana]|nr:MAG: phosphatidic acid phosphatase type 2/haloperoxidase [Piptocephalis tieghemiana]
MNLTWKPWSESRVAVAVRYTSAALILLLAFILEPLVPAFKRHFSPKDPEISFPFTQSPTVPVIPLFLLSYLVPFAAISVIALISHRRWHHYHFAVQGLLCSLAFTALITHILKNTVGRPRPDLLDRCQPHLPDPVPILVDISVCKEDTEYLINDGFKSFPSGHSSYSFAGLGYLGFYLAGQFRLLRAHTPPWKSLLVLVPFLMALLVAVSRISDYRHHWSDVMVGSILGVSCAWYFYRRHFPALSSPVSHSPNASFLSSTPCHESADYLRGAMRDMSNTITTRNV